MLTDEQFNTLGWGGRLDYLNELSTKKTDLNKELWKLDQEIYAMWKICLKDEQKNPIKRTLETIRSIINQTSFSSQFEPSQETLDDITKLSAMVQNARDTFDSIRESERLSNHTQESKSKKEK